MFKELPIESHNMMFAIRRIDFTHNSGTPMYVQVWLHKVMFGWRVYTCCTDARDVYPHPRLDWNLCMGKNAADISMMYNIICSMIVRDLPMLKKTGELRPFPSFSRRPIPTSDEWLMFLEHHAQLIDKDIMTTFTQEQLDGWATFIANRIF